MAKDDARLKAEFVEFASPQGYGKMKGYLVRPAKAAGKLPGVLVIHENRGLNPHIEDIARRVALDNFVAFAPDALTPLGGYPAAGEDEARDALRQARTAQDARRHGGGGRLPEAPTPSAPAGSASSASATAAASATSWRRACRSCWPRCRSTAARRRPRTCRRSRRSCSSTTPAPTSASTPPWPAYEAALKAAGVKYTMHMYPGTQHGFNNDTTPRYDKAAAAEAWKRTIAFFNRPAHASATRPSRMTAPNALGQPIGPPLDGWQAPPRPPPRPSSTAAWARLEPLDPDRHARALFDANALDTEGRNWTYLPVGPFAAFDGLRRLAAPDGGRRRPAVLHHRRPRDRSAGGRRQLPADRSGGRLDRGRPHQLLAAGAAHAAATEAMYLMMRAGLRARLSPLRMEVRRAERAVARGRRALRLHLRGPVPAGHRSTRAAAATRRGTRFSITSSRRSNARSARGWRPTTSTPRDASVQRLADLIAAARRAEPARAARDARRLSRTVSAAAHARPVCYAAMP